MPFPATSIDPSVTTNNFIPATGNTPGTAFYNSNRDQPVDAVVPTIIEETGDLVREFLDFNRTSVGDAITLAQTALAALSGAALPPSLPDPPPAPNIITTFNAQLGLGFDQDPDFGTITPEATLPFFVDDIVVPDIQGDMPSFTSLLTSVNIPDSPTYTEPPEPTAPGIITDFVTPDAPAKDYGGEPQLDEITLPVYTAPTIPTLTDTPPTFNIAAPMPVIQWVEPTYSSTVQNAVRTDLLTMLAGGTGLDPDVELAIWERGRSREETIGRRTIDAAINEWAARGFDHPQGQLNSEILVINEETARKITELSREVMIEQAKLEQTNRQFAIEQGINYERVFTAVYLAVVDRNFQIAKFAVETQLNIFNAQIAVFNVERQIYEAKIAKYRVDLDAVFVQLKAFEALVSVEKAKAEINTAKVQAFEAKVRAYAAQVDAYKSLIESISVRAELQKSKVDVFRAQIEAMVAKINGQRAKFEAFDARIRGETAKVQLEEANVRSYTGQVQAWVQKSETLLKTTDVQIQSNKQTLDWNIANMQRAASFVAQLVNVIQAKVTAFQANTTRGTAKYNADKEARMAELQAQISIGQINIAKYQALMRQWEVRSQEVIQFGLAQIESLKAVAAFASNWVAGALAGTHVSAGLSGSASAGQNNSRSSTDSTSQSASVTEQNQYAVNHNYQHRV